jgi:hypothetical protein
MTDQPTSTGTVASALQALRYNPLIIGVLLLNLLFVGVSAWYLSHTAEARHEAIQIILDRCIPSKK